MPSLVFTPRYTDDSQLLWKAACAAGWQVERLSNWRVPDNPDRNKPIYFYGEALFAPMLAEQLEIELLSPAPTWLVNLGARYKLREIRALPMKEARDITTPTFIKPPNDKSFTAGVYLGSELTPDYPDHELVLCSEVVTWEIEFRCFILNRELLTYSLYARNGESQQEQNFYSDADEDAKLEEFVMNLLSDQTVELPEAIVLDVGFIRDRGWACVELNAAWGSGIYACDPGQVLRVLERSIRQLPQRKCT